MRNPATIRKYTSDDKEAVRHVCIETASGFSEKKYPVLLNLFCDYYIEQEPQNCFVLDSNGTVVGYILTSADWQTYVRRYRETYLAPLRRLSPVHYLYKKHELKTQKCTEQYPAHLHIDIIESFQRGGYGTQLIDAALANLKTQGILGIQLGVGAKNSGAIKFYERYGFLPLHRSPAVTTYGKKL